MTTNETMTTVDRLLEEFDRDWPDTQSGIENAIRRAAGDALRAMAARIEGDTDE